MCYSMMFVFREGLDDLQYIRNNENVVQDHLSVRFIRISMGVLIAFTGALGYIVRDSSIIADNTNLNQLNLKGIEKIQQIQNQIIYEDIKKEPKIYKTPICEDCKQRDPRAKDARYNIPSDSLKCELCGKDTQVEDPFKYWDMWFVTPTASVNSNSMGEAK